MCYPERSLGLQRGGRQGRALRRAVLDDQMFVLPYRWVIQINFISGKYSFWKRPQCRFFSVVKGGAKVSLEPTGSVLPSAQNSPRTKVAHFRESHTEPLHKHGYPVIQQLKYKHWPVCAGLHSSSMANEVLYIQYF